MGKRKKHKKLLKINNGRRDKRKHNVFHRSKSKSLLPNQKKRTSSEITTFPLPFPSSLKYPRNGFLRNEAPYKESFEKALETSYEGFIIDQPETFSEEKNLVEQALSVMEDAGFFRVDVTQPFGLGTKCAKTYVTRCLVGENGSTYKYLGLRMFSHPWNTESGDICKKISNIDQALRVIRQLNTKLSERTKKHLDNLDRRRLLRGSESTRGRACFDISLINRMESSDGLKDEPSMGEGKCSVSWHADSSLEHYSTIAVYQQLSRERKNSNDQWSVGLRVAHNSEGPEASKRGSDIVVVEETPPISVSLPSGSSYYLLDDFNHHHQHAVIADGNPSGKRFSSTHRLLRESHNVAHILARCMAVCRGFHRKGPKIWRSEQLLLTEMESDWLRQFFIQGRLHFNLLWKSWGKDIKALLKYWSKLEERTKQTIDLLQFGAEGNCGLDKATKLGDPAPPKAERKLRERRRKAKDCLQDLVTRSGSTSLDFYNSMATLLEERAKMRMLWSEREKDRVFHAINKADRPISVPFDYATKGDGNKSEMRGFSPMVGSPIELLDLARNLRKFGVAFLSRNKFDLPSEKLFSMTSSFEENLHRKPLDWPGWAVHTFGLEMQEPWASSLLLGKKSIETRSYDLPESLIGKKIEILQSMKGHTGISTIKNEFEFGDDSKIKVIGWCKFKSVIKYSDEETFVADKGKHLVDNASGYGWKDGLPIYGWVVAEYSLYQKKTPSHVNGIRRLRSLFQIEEKCDKRDRSNQSMTDQNRCKKKRRIQV